MIRTEGLESFVAYRICGQELDIYNAYVPEFLRGRGYASDLILHAIHYAVLNGLLVRANCPAAEAYIKRNPEWNFTLTALEEA